MNTFHYVYILQSEKDPTKHYTGFTENLKIVWKNTIMEKFLILLNSNLGKSKPIAFEN